LIDPPSETGALRQSLSAPPGHRPDRAVCRILFALAGFAIAGAAFDLWVRDIPAGRPDPRAWFNVFYVLFARHEPLGLAVVALFSLITGLYLSKPHSVVPTTGNQRSLGQKRLLAWLAICVFAVTACGTHLVSHNYALTADENLADFQAKIFLRGKSWLKSPPNGSPLHMRWPLRS